MKEKGLSQEALKIIACLTMLMDHVGAVLLPQYHWLRGVGRIAFPIFCFLLAEGAVYTRNPRKYLLRLLIGAVLSEIPFDLCFYGRIYWGYQNVMLTLVLAFIGILAMKRWKWGFFIGFFCGVAAEWLQTDYGFIGVMFVLLFFATRSLPKPWRWVVQTTSLAILAWGIGLWELWCLFALIPIFFYSGKKHSHSPQLQWGFYLFYPVHLLVLFLIRGIF